MNKFTTILLRMYYRLVYDQLYSIWYSLKDIASEMWGFILEFKKPNTWSTLLYIACFYAFMTKNFQLFLWLIPGIALVYLIRQRVDGRYRHEMYISALMSDNDMLLQDDYEKYKRECFFTKQSCLDYTQWKESEKNKLKSNSTD